MHGSVLYNDICISDFKNKLMIAFQSFEAIYVESGQRQYRKPDLMHNTKALMKCIACMYPHK